MNYYLFINDLSCSIWDPSIMVQLMTNKRRYIDFQQPIGIPPNELHVWAVNLATCSIGLEDFYPLLSKDEYIRSKQYRFEKDRIYFVTARGVLRRILSRYLSIQPEKIEFSYNPYGKPFLNTALHFNVSHSGDLALYIIAHDRPVGIDLEKIHRIEGYEDIAERFFSPQENFTLNSIPKDSRLKCFFKCWTRKEAFIKTLGNGLFYPLHEFEVSFLPNKPARLLTVQGNAHLAVNWSLSALVPCIGYEAAFSCHGKYETVNYRWYENHLP